MAKRQHIYHFIYKTTCKITNRFYIGMHSTSNLSDGYIGSGKILIRSIKKYGRENHIFEIIEHCLNRESLRSKEEELVNHITLKDPMCMNIKVGGTTDYIGENKRRGLHYEDIFGKNAQFEKKKRAESVKNFYASLSPEKKQQRNKKISEKVKKYVEHSSSPKQKQYTCPHCGKNGAGSIMIRWHFDNCSSLTGVKREVSKETKNKISNSLKGKINSNNPFLKKGRTPANKGIRYKRVICPHCRKDVSISIANIHHFNNCLKINNSVKI